MIKEEQIKTMHGILSLLDWKENENNIGSGIGKWMPPYILGESMSWYSICRGQFGSIF